MPVEDQNGRPVYAWGEEQPEHLDRLRAVPGQTVYCWSNESTCGSSAASCLWMTTAYVFPHNRAGLPSCLEGSGNAGLDTMAATE